jgi:hypothetical protein
MATDRLHWHPVHTTSAASIVAAVVIVAISGGPATAQEERPARIRVGTLSLTPKLVIQDVGYDSNVYNVDDQPTSDFTFTVIPTFLATAGTARHRLTVRSATGLVYFSEQRSERSINQDVNATMRVALRRLFVFADGGYLNTRQRPTEEIDVRSRRNEHRGTAGLGIAVSPKLSAQVSGGSSRTAFDADALFNGTLLADELNQTNRTIAGGVRYAATPLTTLSIDSAVDKTRFTRAPMRDANSFRTVIGIETRPRALVAGSVAIGVQRFRPLVAAMPDFDGMVGSADLKYRLSGSTTLGFRLDRMLASSYLVADPYYVRAGYAMSVRRQLVARWNVDVSGRRFSHRYRHADVVPADHVTPDERFLEGQMAVTYQARGRTSLSVFLTYYDRHSAFASRTFDSVRVGTSLVYGF